MLSLKTNPKLPGDWKERHNAATMSLGRPFESAIVHMLEAWARYADDHRARYESPIGEDYVLGPEWRDIGLGIRGLLNGETGRLDCGTLDGFILDTLKAEGIETWPSAGRARGRGCGA